MALGVVVLVTLLDHAVEGAVLIAALMLGPLLAATRLGPRPTALVTGVAIALAISLGLLTGSMDSDQQLASTSVAVAASLLAIWIASLRQARELAVVRLRAQRALRRAGVESSSLAEAAPRMLAVIGRTFGWDAGVLWEAAPGSGVLRRAGSWRRTGLELGAFEQPSHEDELPPGAGLPGRVLERGEAAWIRDVRAEAGDPRYAAAAAAGVRSAVAFPTRIRPDDPPLAVIEFVSCGERAPDPALLDAMSAFGALVAQYIEAKRGEDELHRSRDQLDAILGGLADGVTVQEPSGRLVYANDAAARTLGFSDASTLIEAPVDEVLSRFELFDEQNRPLGPERLPGRRALAGEAPGELLVRFKAIATGIERWSIVKATPVRDDSGRVVMAVNIFEDITEHKRTEMAQRFLADTGLVLGASLDYSTTLQSVTRLAVPGFADWCAVDLLGRGGAMEHVAVAHADSSRLSMVEELRRRYPPDPNAPRGAPHVARTGTAQLIPAVSDDLLAEAAVDEDHLRLLRSLGIHSAMIAPLRGREGVFGAITFVTAESGRTFDERDLALAEEIGRRAGTAIENARVYEERAEIARTLQRSLLPPHLPEIPGIEVAARYRAAGEGVDVGGDFYDVFDLGGATWALVLGDVCGKGADAAGTTALARYTLRAASMRERRPSRVLAQLNEALLRQRADRQFCTVLYAALYPGSRRVEVELSSGGHPLPLVIRRDGTLQWAGVGGTLLGVVDDPDLADSRLDLRSGDTLVMYTDGVTEARTADGLFGSDGLEAVARGAAGEPPARLAELIERAAAEGELRDDVAIVVVRVSDSGVRQPAAGSAAPGVASDGAEPLSAAEVELRLPASAEAVGMAREAVDGLAPSLPAPLLEDLRLLVSELVTNGLRHGRPRAGDWIGLSVRRPEGSLYVEVSDPGKGFDARTPVSAPDRPGGWGLYLVERLARRWGVRTGERTSVWFELELAGEREEERELTNPSV